MLDALGVKAMLTVELCGCKILA